MILAFAAASILRALLFSDFFDMSTPFVDSFADSFETSLPPRLESPKKGINEPSTATAKVPSAGIRGLATLADCLTCGFDFLETGVFVSSPSQTSDLMAMCGFTVTAMEWNGANAHKNVNVFDTASPTAGDYDLGSPHASCGGDPLVNGMGGHKDAIHPNCSPQGKCLVIQDPDSPEAVPDDEADGGCMVFSFDPLFTPASIGILDGEDDDNLSIEVSRNGVE